MRIHQYNCQRSASVVHEFGQSLLRMGATFALIQEPYVGDGCVRGLPGGMRVFTDEGGDSAIVVVDSDIDCTVVSSSQWGLCLSVEWAGGKMLLASIYCRFSSPLEPYLRYMDTVLLLASSCPLILGLDYVS